MKILVFADVHGNLSSLKALSETNDFRTADKLIFLGDVMFGCSRPNECIDLLDSIDCECLMGNNDFYVCDHIPEVDLVVFDNVKLPQLQYMKDILSSKHNDIMQSWKRELYLNIENFRLYFTHYPWENYQNDINVIDTPKIKDLQARQKMFENIDADYIFFGHEHKSNYFYDESKHYYCIGSLGLKSPANYLLINIADNQISIDEKSIEYDIDYEIELMDKAGYPYSKSKIKI